MVPIVFIMLLFIHCTRSDCIIDNRNYVDAIEVQLHKDLLRCYHILESPKPNGTVEITVMFLIKYYNYESDEQVFTTQVWVYLAWQDDRLRWNASDYDGINETLLMSSRIWTKGMRLFNGVDQDDSEEFFYSLCQVMSNGRVKCRVRTIFKTWCSTNLTNWPLDSQTCVLKFGEWHTHGAVRYKFRNPSVLIPFNGGYWKLVDFKGEEVPSSDIHLRLTFNLNRDALFLVAVVIHPCVVLSVFTIACLFLDVRSNLRLKIICFCLACHIYLLSSTNIYIPKHSAEPPSILLYYRGSIIITTIAIILTLVLSALCKRETTPPFWLSSFNEVVWKSQEKIAILPRWTCDDRKEQDWVDFANFVNTMYTVLSIVGYLSMYFAFIP